MRSTILTTRNLALAFAFLPVAAGLYLTPTYALQAPAPAQKQTATALPLNLTAKSANVAESGTPVKISILRWSTEEERNPVVVTLDPVAQAAAQAAAGARGARGARGGRGAAAGLDPDDPALADAAPTARGGRAGRAGRGDEAAPAKPADPIAALVAAISKAPTVGYLWTNEVVGYSIKYAYRTSLPDGGERIIIATDRRLGAGSASWKLMAAGTPTDYQFTLIELRIDSKGLGEGKTSLTNTVVLDKESKSLALDNYVAAPPILQNVKRNTSN